jgi:hypothetical protein
MSHFIGKIGIIGIIIVRVTANDQVRPTDGRDCHYRLRS